MLTFDLSNNSLAIFWLSTPGPLTWIGPGSLSQKLTKLKESSFLCCPGSSGCGSIGMR